MSIRADYERDEKQGMTEAQKIMKRFDWITSGVRVLMLTQRRKEGGKFSNPDRHMHRIVTWNEDEFEKALTQLLEGWTSELRIYCSINERNMNKAIYNFKQIQLEMDYQSVEQRNGFYFDIKNRFISALMKHSARDSSYFLIDIDNDDRHKVKVSDVDEVLKKEEVVIISKYPTKNGWHFITLPFDYPRKTPMLKKFDHIKVDDLALLKFK